MSISSPHSFFESKIHHQFIFDCLKMFRLMPCMFLEWAGF